MMHRFARRLARGAAVGTLFTVYQMSGCDLALDQTAFQNVLDSFGGFSDVSFDFSAEADHDSGHSEDHGDSHDDSGLQD